MTNPIRVHVMRIVQRSHNYVVTEKFEVRILSSAHSCDSERNYVSKSRKIKLQLLESSAEGLDI
jgi:hypothetical protein